MKGPEEDRSLGELLSDLGRQVSTLVRQEVEGRRIRYTIQSYASDRPEGARYAP